MPGPKGESATLAKLRREAEVRLKEGSAPTTAGWSVGVHALSLLHELASQPGSAVDALKLLHELQVYQVELDLQHEQIESTHRDIVEDMALYRGLFECSPAAYLSLTLQRDIAECNIAAAKLFDVEQEKLRGSSVETFVAPASRPQLIQLLKRLRPDGPSGSCELQLGNGYGSHHVQVVASAAPDGKSLLVMFIDLPARR
jgi:PAS domain S-box-containing protein